MTNPELRRVTFTYKMHRLQARSSTEWEQSAGPSCARGPAGVRLVEYSFSWLREIDFRRYYALPAAAGSYGSR